ncbi:MAG: peptide deformylase [Candidatus Omnitrophota bacterium]|jgi:peptide deformylase|nr:MAG: peptide deformylase [Candidatus Omnitrophota bacterium]
MAIELKIRTYPDPVLRNKAKAVTQVTEEHRQILSLMARLMYSSSGIGLAAPQVGISNAMIIVDIGSGLYKVINPKITKRSGSQAIEEGCLSVPGICLKVKRANNIVVNGLDENGKPVEIRAEGLLACVFQHEIDHLFGKLIVDYASMIDKIKMGHRVKALKRKFKDERMSQPETKSCKLQL